MTSLLLLLLAAPTAEQARFFESKVRPLLVAHCQECHGAKKQSGGLRLDTKAGIEAGGDHGPLTGTLLPAVRHEDRKMPKKKLPDADLDVLAKWAAMGYPWPAGGPSSRPRGAITDEDRAWWAFQPLKDAAPPEPKHGRAETGIDRFILAKLEEKGLRPAPEAGKRTLLRRLSFDLTGLPPAPDDPFLADPRPDAWERLVDRLLSSPAYGERWGRHWLDVVRYADTAGDNSDYPIPQAHLYRNWVVSAVNADMPFDQFVREQVAGDLIPGATDAQKIATGYLAGVRRFGSYEDKRYQWWLTYEDAIENAGRAFLGLGLSCARCHDHKFDPVSQEDYYALYGIFRGTRFPWPGIELDKKQRDLVPIAGGAAYAVAEGKRWIGDAKVHLAGDPAKEGKTAPRRFLRILGGQPVPAEEKGSGRRQLAEWLVAHPLSARVLVNRLWLHHFGRGLVSTPNDFGRQGRPPSHPELLDWLAARFKESGGSMKAMHRLMSRSAAYRQSSDAGEEKLLKDPEGEWLSRWPRRRLDAESIRDSLLMLGGKLDRSPGGPHPFPPMAKWDFTQHKPFKAVYETDRRSVYLMTQRIQRHPFLALFDGADTNASTAKRGSSTTPLQALYLMNDPFALRMADGFAARLMAEREEDRIERAFLLAFGRKPASEEKEAAQGALGRMRAKGKDEGRAWRSFARAVLMANELVYVD
ncbi:MAG: PSD1 and planctomycete cytochrome C domain-containing protein [Gemmataceae bacterium]|nr:PSD1 and planctomycete cytochrome C domain-containing protein [Gemmataceae bacterium]